MRAIHLWSIPCFVLAIVGCSSGSNGAPTSEQQAGGATPAGVASTAPGAVDAIEGITREEADERGVAVARYDARLEPIERGQSSASFRLVNIGDDDRYQIQLVEGDGLVSPTEAALASGESVQIDVTDATADAELVVVSEGSGIELARLPVVAP
jgi:hypothetical protein